MAEYVCKVCGYIYSESDGCEEMNVAPGTKWTDVPDDFECPLCGVGKEEFELKQKDYQMNNHPVNQRVIIF